MPVYRQSRFDGGLNIAQQRGLLRAHECWEISNFRFNDGSVIRRDGCTVAYSESTGAANAVSAMFRFYRLKVTGAVTPVFFKFTGTLIYKGDSSFDDDAPAAIASTEIPKPQVANSSLQTGLTDVTVTAGAMTTAFQAQSWAYIVARYDSTDDTNITKNVPMRTDGTKVYLHGLQEPAAPTSATEVNVGLGVLPNGNYRYVLTYIYDDGTLGESGIGTPIVATVAGGPSDIDVTVAAPTDDVSFIRIYRQEKNKTVDDSYYLVREITVSAVAFPYTTSPSDTTTDLVLVTLLKADRDVYKPPKYKTAVMWKDRCIIGNTKCRDTSSTVELDFENAGIHKGRIRFSEPFTPDRFRRLTWLEPLPDGGSGELKRLIINPILDACFAVYEDDVMALVGQEPPYFPRNVAFSKGTPAPNSVVEHEGIIYYVTKTGIEAVVGFEARNVTNERIAPLWNIRESSHASYADRINPAQFAIIQGEVNRKANEIWWSYPSAASNTHDRVLVLDVNAWRASGMRTGEGAFSIFRGWRIGCFNVWRGEGDEDEIFGGEADPTKRDWIYRLDFDNEDTVGAGAATVTNPIAARLNMAIHDYGVSDRDKMFRRLYVEAKSGTANAELTIDVNDGALTHSLGTHDFSSETSLWGASTWGVGSWNGPRVSSKTLALPKEAIGARMGLKLSVNDLLDASGDGPEAFALFATATDFEVLNQRVRV